VPTKIDSALKRFLEGESFSLRRKVRLLKLTTPKRLAYFVPLEDPTQQIDRLPWS
jgi:hypothetical protein